MRDTGRRLLVAAGNGRLARQRAGYMHGRVTPCGVYGPAGAVVCHEPLPLPAETGGVDEALTADGERRAEPASVGR